MLKAFERVFICFTVCFSAIACFGGETKVKPDTIDTIQEVLSPGWSIEVKENVISIKRDKKVHAHLSIPSMSEDMAKKEFWEFGFTLLLTSYMSPENYSVAYRKNSKLGKKAEELYKTENIADIPHKTSKPPRWLFTYLPRNEKERLAVKRYKQLYQQIKRLPDLHYNKQSFFIGGSRFTDYHFTSEKEKHECLAVYKNVMKIFHTYDVNGNQEGSLHNTQNTTE